MTGPVRVICAGLAFGDGAEEGAVFVTKAFDAFAVCLCDELRNLGQLSLVEKRKKGRKERGRRMGVCEARGRVIAGVDV